VCSSEFAALHGLDRTVRIAAQAMTTDSPSSFADKDMTKLVRYDMT
jgi:hypothetical protein